MAKITKMIQFLSPRKLKEPFFLTCSKRAKFVNMNVFREKKTSQKYKYAINATKIIEKNCNGKL